MKTEDACKINQYNRLVYLYWVKKSFRSLFEDEKYANECDAINNQIRQSIGNLFNKPTKDNFVRLMVIGFQNFSIFSYFFVNFWKKHFWKPICKSRHFQVRPKVKFSWTASLFRQKSFHKYRSWWATHSNISNQQKLIFLQKI